MLPLCPAKPSLRGKKPQASADKLACALHIYLTSYWVVMSLCKWPLGAKGADVAAKGCAKFIHGYDKMLKSTGHYTACDLVCSLFVAAGAGGPATP